MAVCLWMVIQRLEGPPAPGLSVRSKGYSSVQPSLASLQPRCSGVMLLHANSSASNSRNQIVLRSNAATQLSSFQMDRYTQGDFAGKLGAASSAAAVSMIQSSGSSTKQPLPSTVDWVTQPMQSTAAPKAARLRVTQADCAEMDDADNKAWCMTMLPADDGGVSLRAKRRNLEKTLGNCQWEVDPKPESFVDLKWSARTNTTSGPENTYDRDHFNWKGNNATVKLTRCKGVDDEGNQWVFARVGPLVTNGGYDWSSSAFEALTFPEFQDQLVLVSGFHVGSTTRDGRIIAYPPIHQHHFHVVPAGVDIAHESGVLSMEILRVLIKLAAGDPEMASPVRFATSLPVTRSTCSPC